MRGARCRTQCAVRRTNLSIRPPSNRWWWSSNFERLAAARTWLRALASADRPRPRDEKGGNWLEPTSYKRVETDACGRSAVNRKGVSSRISIYKSDPLYRSLRAATAGFTIWHRRVASHTSRSDLWQRGRSIVGWAFAIFPPHAQKSAISTYLARQRDSPFRVNF